MIKKIVISTLIVLMALVGASVWVQNMSLISTLECAFDPSKKYLASAFFNYRGGADSPATFPKGAPVSTGFDIRIVSDSLKDKSCTDIINSQVSPIYEASGGGIVDFIIKNFRIVWAEDSKSVQFLYLPLGASKEEILHQVNIK